MSILKKQRPVRSYEGNKWITNKTNKKHLAVDFNHRCAYCDDWDYFNGEYRAYHVEHFAPKEKFPELKYTYTNLLYACPYCNGSKSDKWPSSDANVNVVGDVGFLDPCEDDYYKNLHRNSDGSIGYDTPLGEYIYSELSLGLKRHKYIFRITELYELLKLLKEKISKWEADGRDVTRLKKYFNEANEFFFDEIVMREMNT